MTRKPKPSFYYNCKPSGDLYRITKFDADANPEGSYLTDGIECDCPAGVRPTCRHRQMLPLFRASNALNGEAFFNFDQGTWIGGEESSSEIIPEIVLEVTSAEPHPTPAATPAPSHTSTGLRRI